MAYANSGNLDTYIASRHSSAPSLSLQQDHSSDEEPTPEELKRRLRERRKSRTAATGDTLPRPEMGRGDARAVMLFGIEEIASLFGDVVNGLHFLVSFTVPFCVVGDVTD